MAETRMTMQPSEGTPADRGRRTRRLSEAGIARHPKRTIPKSTIQQMTSPLPGRLEAWCLSARLHLLYKALVDPVTNRPHTLRGTIKAMQLRFGPEYAPSTGFLSDLVAGRRDNPSAKTLWALAEFFGVPMEYFTGQPTAAVVDQILRQTLDHPVVREVALGVATLPAASQEAVLRLVQGLANSEGVRAEDE